jgi:transcriptional regulator GlxA family with amidase domain
MMALRPKWHFSLISGHDRGIPMIGVLIFPDFQLLDAAGPISAFEIAARFAGGAPAIKAIALQPGPVRSSSGVEMLARSAKPSVAITTLIIAGAMGCGKHGGARRRSLSCGPWPSAA